MTQDPMERSARIRTNSTEGDPRQRGRVVTLSTYKALKELLIPLWDDCEQNVPTAKIQPITGDLGN